MGPAMVNPRRLRKAAERTATTPMGMVGDASSSGDEGEAMAAPPDDTL